MTKKRVDILLFEKGFVSTRAQGTMLVKKSGVYCDGVLIDKPGLKFRPEVELRLVEESLYVSRGAYKLIAALDQFHISVSCLVCADIGASTGGFTEVLLERGARKVFAIDVGRNQLAEKLKNHSKVINMEGVNARHPIEIGEQVDLIVSDLSHISLTKVLPEALKLLKKGGIGVWLIKPQFEGGLARIGKKGIVDPKYHDEIVEEVLGELKNQGVSVKELIPSPITGKTGNQEFLVWFTKD